MAAPDSVPAEVFEGLSQLSAGLDKLAARVQADQQAKQKVKEQESKAEAAKRKKAEETRLKQLSVRAQSCCCMPFPRVLMLTFPCF